MKKLLKESEIRKMMKFANIGGLTDGFVERLHETSMYDEDDEFGLSEQEALLNELDDEEEVPDAEEVPDEGGDVPPVDEPVDEPLDDPVGVDEPLDEPAGEPSVDPQEALEGLNLFLKAVTDPTVGPEIAAKIDVTLADEEPELEEPVGEPSPVGLEEPVGEPSPVGPEGEADDLGAAGLGAPEPDEELEEAQIELQEDDDFVNEVVRKVAKRLLRARK